MHAVARSRGSEFVLWSTKSCVGGKCMKAEVVAVAAARRLMWEMAPVKR